MALYESVFIVRQDVTAAQVDTLADDFAKIIQDGGGAVERREYWGLRNLQYRIKKNRKGHYVLFNMDAPSASVVEMERNMRLNEDVLRYLTTRIDEARP
jgi:small subunit ribosomal protein S6